jgi:hypothetical protein
MQASQAVANIYSQAISTVGSIMANPNLDGDARQEAVLDVFDMLEDSLRLQGDVGNIPGLSNIVTARRNRTAPEPDVNQGSGGIIQDQRDPNYREYWYSGGGGDGGASE